MGGAACLQSLSHHTSSSSDHQIWFQILCKYCASKHRKTVSCSVTLTWRVCLYLQATAYEAQIDGNSRNARFTMLLIASKYHPALANIMTHFAIGLHLQCLALLA
jgi:hypothetical protein